MITGVPVAVFLAVTVSLAYSDPIIRRNEGTFFQCAGYCKGSNKFRYTPGSTYIYDYTANTRTYIRGSTKEKSELNLYATAYIYAITQCDLVLQLKDVQLKDLDKRRSSEFSAALEKNSLHFSFQDGTVDELCPSNDPVWVLNIKRGILSAFQNTMHDLHSAREKHHETDVTGTCETKYDVVLEEDITNKPVLYVGKMKNLLACSSRKEHFLSLQSSPYMSSTAQSLPIIKSQQRGSQVIKDNILQKATNNEIHTFRPFSKHESGAVTMVNQVLQFKTSSNRGALRESSPVRRTTLLFEHPDKLVENKNVQSATEILQELVKRTQSGVESSVPSVFSELIGALSPLKYSDILKLYTEATDKNIRRFLLDAMPYVATGDGVKVMAELFNSGEITSEQMDSWFTSLAFQKKPTINMLSSVLTLLDGVPSAKGLLSISALVHSYCQQNKNCLEEEYVIQIMKKIEVLLGPNCESTDQATQQLIILALKAIGNAGIFPGPDRTLKKCLKAQNPIELRLAAISAYRRLPCNENSRSHLLDLYTNKYQDTELRIAAYLAVMQCPTSQTIHKIKDTLYGEEVNQVASFVWTHLTNLQETSSPWKQSIRTLVSSDFLKNKFKTDVRKFSRNYEGSFFSEALNAGAAVESNIIFTPQSYLPRSAALNLTLDVFGETVNILEVGARAEGFEQIVENLFGPGGYFSDGAMNKMLKNLRDKSGTNSLENSINQLSDQFDAKNKLEKDPYASIYTRIFGNEIQYSEFHGLKDVVTTLNNVPSFDIFRKISQEQKIDYKKSFVIIDGLYSIPTCVGLPMNLNLNGTAIVSFNLHGHANIKDLFHLNSIDIEGSVTPSAAVTFTGTMVVDAAMTKAGISLVNNLHTNTYIDGKIKIQGGKLIELKLNVPRDKIEVLDISSQLFVLHNDQYFESKGIEETVENYKLCSTEFVSSLTGMKPCMELTYANTSLQPVAPYFPLTGPFRFHVDVTKVDTFKAYVLTFKQLKEETTSRRETLLSFHFDTPGSKVDRKLSAQYMIDWKNSVAKASLISPFIKISASGKAENSDGAKLLDGSVSLNDQELVTMRLGLRKSHTGQTGRYEPFFSLVYKKQLIADISGKVNYIEGFKCNADFLIKGLTKDTVSISGDFSATDDKYEMFANIKSTFLTSSLHASLRSAENYLSTKATIQYKTLSSQQHTMDFSAKLQDNSRGSLIRNTLYTTLQMSQFPRYNAEALWDLQYSEQYLENNAKLALGDTVWETKQLYRHYVMDSNLELALLCTLACPAFNIDYGVDIKHQVTNESISSHFITRITPQYKMSANLDYLQWVNHHRLDLDITNPWYKTGLTGIFIERAPGKHEIEASSWWAQDKHLHVLNITGFYIDGSNRVKTEHLLDVMLYGALNGKLGAGITTSSNSNNQWIELEVYNKTYLINATYIRDVFHFMEGTLKLGDSTYGGSLVLLSTGVEKGFAIDLKLRKRLTMATKILYDGEKHGLQVELFWDKDTNPNKKISLMAQAMGNRKEVLLEIPGRYLKGEVVTIPSGVIGLLEWAEHQKISTQLEWNLDEGSAEITVKLKTPFPSMESVSLFATYTMLENEGIFVVDGSWQKEKLTLTTTVRRNNTISGYWGMKLITHMESTIPSLEHLSFNLDHSSYVNEQWVFKTVALLKYNSKQSDFKANWSYNKSSLYGDIMLISPIQNFEYIKQVLQYTETSEDISGSLEVNWTREKKVSGEFVIKRVSGSSGAFRIVTPYEGYETTSAEYNFTKFQDKNGTTYIRMGADAVYNECMFKIDISGSRFKSSFDGNLQLKTPFTEELKLNLLHSLKEGKLNEVLNISLAERQLLQLLLDIEANSVSHLQLSASFMAPNQDLKLILTHNLYPGILQFYCEGLWNDKNIFVDAIGKYQNSNEILLIQFNGTVNGSLLSEKMKILLNHSSTGRKSKTDLQLPYNIFLNNILMLNNTLNWNNKFTFRTSTKSLTIENKQNFNDFILEHRMNSELNGQQASAVISYKKDPKNIIREMNAYLRTPWSDPVIIEYTLPADNLILKPNFILKFKHTKEIKIKTELIFNKYDSKVHLKITSPFYKPIVFDSGYELGETNLSSQLLIQWEAKNITAEAKIESDLSFMKSSGGFFIRHSEVNGDMASGRFEYDINNPETTAHILGTFKECKIDFFLSLMAMNSVYKGTVSMQTPLRNWKNFSLSGEVNLAKPIKLVNVTLTKERAEIALRSLFGYEVDSSRFRITLDGQIFNSHKLSFYSEYNVSVPNNHIFNLACGYNDKTIELTSKLEMSDKSLLNSVTAECNLKTPFENYKSLSAYGSYNMKGPDKSLNLHLIKDTLTFKVESMVSFGIEKGNSHIVIKLPFDDLKEMSATVQYGFNPTTQERTLNLKISRNNLTVDVLGALLLTDNGSLTAGLELTSPVEGYKKLKCSASLSASKEQQKSATVIFSKEHDDYAITGMFLNFTEARIIITTPLKNYEKIYANIGYIINKDDDITSGIKGNVYAVLEMPTSKSEMSLDVDIQKLNSTVRVILYLPLLQIPQIQLQGKYDVRSFPASFSIIVNKNMTKFINMQMTLENNRLVGELSTPIDGYKNILISGSVKFQKEMNKVSFQGIFGEHTFQATTSLSLDLMTSEIQTEFTSDFSGIEKIAFHGQYDFQKSEKTAFLSITINPNSNYELIFTGSAISNIGHFRIQMYTPVSGYETLLLIGMYDFKNDYSASIALERNNEKKKIGGHVVFTADETAIRIETPFKEAKYISLYGRYYSKSDEYSAQLKITTNEHTVLVESSFKFQNNVAVMKIKTPYEFMREIIISADFSGIMLSSKESNFTFIILRNSEYVLRTFSYIMLDWENKIETKIEFDSIFVPKEYKNLKFLMSLTPTFPPTNIQMFVMKHDITILKLESNIDIKPKGFTYSLKLSSQVSDFEKWLMSVDYYPQNILIIFNADIKSAGNLKQCKGELRFDNFTGEISAFFTSPIVGYERFSFKMRKGYNFINSELILPFKDFENISFVANYELQPQRKSGSFLIINNDKRIEFKTSLENVKNDYEMNLFIITPLPTFKKFVVFVQYMQPEMKKIIKVNIATNDQSLQMESGIIVKPTLLSANLDISSTMIALQNISLLIFYDTSMTDAFTVGAKLKTAEKSNNISVSVDYDLWEGELLASFYNEDEKVERKIMWNLENDQEITSAMFAMNLGHELNFVFDGFVRSNSLKDTESQVTFTTFPNREVVSIQSKWNITSISAFYADLSILVDDMTILSLSGIVDLDNATGSNKVHIEHLGIPFGKSKIHIEYLLMNNSNIGLTSEILLNGWDLVGSLNFSPYKANSTMKCNGLQGHVHFFLGYDLTSQFKLFDIKYQYRHYYYAFSSNVTLEKLLFPLVTLQLKMPTRHYSSLKFSNQYIINSTHTGMKILLEKEKNNGEISFLLWKEKKKYGLEGNLSIPLQNLKTWYGIVSFDTTSEFLGIINIIQDSSDYLSAQIRCSPHSMRANVRTPIKTYEVINAEYFLDMATSKNGYISLKWGEHKLLVNATMILNKNKISKISFFFASPWTNDFGFTGQYQNEKSTKLTVDIMRGSEITQIEGHLKYTISDLKFDIDFISEFNNQKVLVKADYDFMNPVRKANFNIKFGSSSFQGSGILNADKIYGNMDITLPFSNLIFVNAEGEYNFGKSLELALKWNDKLFNFKGEHDYKYRYLNGSFSLITPYVTVDDAKFSIAYGIALTDIKIENLSKSLFIFYNHQFERKTFSVQSIIKVPTEVLSLGHLSFSADIDIEKVSASVTTRWNTNKSVNVSASIVPDNLFIMLETPFKDVKRIMARGNFKNEEHQLGFIGSIQTGSKKDTTRVQIEIGKILSGQMKYLLYIGTPSGKNLSCTSNFQLNDPRNIHAKFVLTNGDTDLVIESRLNIKDLVMNLTINLPGFINLAMDGGITYKTWKNVKINSNIKYGDMGFTSEGSYTLSNKHFDSQLKVITPRENSTTTLGGFYEFNGKGGMEIKLYFNDDQLLVSYQINPASFIGNMRFNSKIMGVNKCSLVIEGAHKPSLQALLAYEYNVYHGKASFAINKTSSILYVTGCVNFEPFFVPMNHTVQVLFNNMIPQNYMKLIYEGKTYHKIKVSYDTDDSKFKIKTDINSKTFGEHEVAMSLKRDWKEMQFDIVNVFSAGWKLNYYDVALFVKYLEINNVLLFHVNDNDGFEGQFDLVSSYLTYEKISLMISIKTHRSPILLEAKFMNGMKTYLATMEILASSGENFITTRIITPTVTILGFNASLLINENILANASLNIMDTLSSAIFKYEQTTQLNIELYIASPYLPKKSVQLVVNTNNKELLMHAGYGDATIGHYITLKGTLNNLQGEIDFTYKIPIISFLQFLTFKGNFKIDPKRAFNFGFTSQFSSQNVLRVETSAEFLLSKSGIDTSIKFIPHGKNYKSYEAALHVPFILSNNMRPQVALNIGNDHTYSIRAIYINLKEMQEVGFGIQYRLRKLGASLKIEKVPVTGIQADLDLPIGDNIGHYGVDFKTHQLLHSMSNHTEIGVAWDKNRIELSYSLSYLFTTVEKILNNEESVECTVILQLKTPFQGYEKNGLQMHVSLSSSSGIIIASLNYPGSSKPFVIELNYELKSYNDATLITQLQIPFIPELEDIAIVVSNKIDEEHGRFRSSVGGHWNKEKLSIHVEGNLTEEIVLKGSVIWHLFGQTNTISADFGRLGEDIFSHCIVRINATTQLAILENAELYIEADLMKTLLINITHNHKNLFGLHVYSNEVTLFGAKVTNPWKSVHFKFGYDLTKDIMIQAELSWDMIHLNKSKLGIIFHSIYGPHNQKEISLTLKLPTRILVLNFIHQQSPAKVEYAGTFSWEKGQIIGFRVNINVNVNSKLLALNTMGRIDLPRRSFELQSYASAEMLEANSLKYAVGGEFLWDAANNRSKKTGIELKRYMSIFEVVLKHVALENDLKIRIEKNGKLSYNELPFKMKIEFQYSDLDDDLITIETFIQQPSKTPLLLYMGFSVCHLSSSVDFSMKSEIAQTSSDNHGRIFAEYLNSNTRQKHRLEIMGKIGILRPEVKISIKTAENLLEAHGLIQTDSHHHVGLLIEILMNQKEPLSLEAGFQIQEPKIELEARYGNSHSYKAYVGIPHSREINFGIKHLLYENEYDDVAVILQLNTSQLLWSRVKWQPKALSELKSSFFQEYADIFHVIQSVGSGYFEIWLKDVTYKYNTLHTVLVNTFDQMVSTSVSELNDVYKDFIQMGDYMTVMYKRNDFYIQDMQPYASKLGLYIKDKASGTWKLLLDGMESVYSIARDILSMVTSTLQIDLSRLSDILNEIKVIVCKTTACIVNLIKEIKQLHASAKEYLKVKIESARLQLGQAEENMKQMVTYVKHHIHDLLTSYVEVLEPYLTYFENTMEILSRRVIDFEDKISEYVLDMVDNVLGAEEIQELIEMYNKYSTWLEELHLQEFIDKIYKLQESIGKLIMDDVRRVCADYLHYVDYAVNVLNNIYTSINAMPVIAYTKQTIIIIYEKAKWTWQHYELSDLLKDQIHNWIENVDKILLQLLNAIDMDASSPTKSLTPSITLRPDIGFIEYSQKLPIDWNGFNELPKFEQLQLYEQVKDQANEIANLEKYRYFLMDTIHDITSNMSIASLLPPFSANGMVIGKHHYITFDKKFYNFMGECSYLLASDFLNNKFSAFVTYKLQNKEIMKSLTILIDQHRIEISSNKYVTVDSKKIELPMQVNEETWIKQTGDKMTVHSDLGIEVECNLHYDFCSVELSGWYFGKTGGLLGTFDYEPTNDFQLPNGTAVSTIEAFTSGWQIGSGRCRSVNYASVPDIGNNKISDATFENNQCTAYFDQLSPLRPCFSRIEVQPYLQMCLSEISRNENGICLSVAAYVSQCRRAGVDVVMPHKCVQCQSSDGQAMNGSDLKVYDGVESKMADIVFVVEQALCMKNINLIEILSKLDIAMSSHGFDTQFSVVSFNGKQFSEPSSQINNGQIWSSKKGTEKLLHSLQSIISKNFGTGSQYAFSALWHASHLPFRETASKTILLIQCSSCTENEADYSDMITMLLENDITLHILQPNALKLRSGQGKTSKVYGVDLNGAFSGRNLKTLVPSLPLLRQVELPKDLCTPLAFETNGTLFNMDRLLQNDTNRVNVKKFLDIWARRIALTAKPSQCQKCQCVANQDGVGQIMCSKCLSPSIEQYLKEWENLKLENLNSQKEQNDYSDWPV